MWGGGKGQKYKKKDEEGRHGIQTKRGEVQGRDFRSKKGKPS